MKAEFVNTSIGPLPSDWELVQFREACLDFFGGGTPSTKEPGFWDGNVPWTTSAHLNGLYLKSGQKWITEAGLKQSSTCLIPAGNVLVGTRVGVGKASVNLIDVAISQDLTGCIVNKARFYPEYLALYLQTPRCQSIFELQKRGATIKGIPREDLYQIEIAAPPLPEQRAIAAVLSKIQAAVEVQEKIVAMLKELKVATMAKLFREGLRGEPLKQTEIGKIPESWEVVQVTDAVSIRQGQVDPRIEPYVSMIHIGPENVEPDTGRLLECRTAREIGLISGKYLFRPGDIVYSKIRPYLRKAVLADFTGICSADMYPLTPKDGFDGRYLHALFLSEIFTSQAVSQQTRTGIPKLNREQLNSILIPKASRPEQREIGQAIAAISERTNGAIRQHSTLKYLFSSMLHLLMTGQVRARSLITEGGQVALEPEMGTIHRGVKEKDALMTAIVDRKRE